MRIPLEPQVNLYSMHWCVCVCVSALRVVHVWLCLSVSGCVHTLVSVLYLCLSGGASHRACVMSVHWDPSPTPLFLPTTSGPRNYISLVSFLHCERQAVDSSPCLPVPHLFVNQEGVEGRWCVWLSRSVSRTPPVHRSRLTVLGAALCRMCVRRCPLLSFSLWIEFKWHQLLLLPMVCPL